MFESILAGFLIAFMFLGMFLSFYEVDKPRKPIKLGAAIIGAILNGVIIWLLWKAYL